MRIKVLERLAQSKTPAADEATRRACEQAIAVLADGVEYEALEFSLDVLLTVGFRHSKEVAVAADAFLRTVEARSLVHLDDHVAQLETLSQYRNARRLMSKAIDLLNALRYLETPAVVDSLLWASKHEEVSVRKAAFSDLGGLAKYNISVYFGDGTSAGIGSIPQVIVIDVLEGKVDEYLRTHLGGVLTLLGGLLSTSMESTNWSSTGVTLSRAVAPAHEGVVDVRRRSISLVKRLYQLVETKSQKLSVIGAMNTAARGDGRGVIDKGYLDMISANALEVLRFFGDIAKEEEDLQIIQKLEHNSYWIHFHSASAEVKAAALEVKTIIDANAEYGIYKALVGFEGIFGDWTKDRKDESYTLGSRESRVKQCKGLAAQVPAEGFAVWRARIVRFAQTESDDLATFPVFYEFLADVAATYPEFALDLLTEDAEQLSKFLIPLLRGVWDSERRAQLLPLMTKWIDEAQAEDTSLLAACAKVFLSTKDVDFSILEKILEKATLLHDVFAIRQVASVAVGRSDAEAVQAELKRLFLRALPRLTELGDAGWVREIWYRKEATEMVAEFSSDERREVLKNLRFLPQIDYQAEDVLAAIAEREPHLVVEFLCDRLYEPDQHVAAVAEKAGGDYEELPYQFQTLQDSLSKDPKVVVAEVMDRYSADDTLFEFRGAKLLQAIFPQFSESFQAELVRLVREGSDKELDFVAGVLRAYSGEAFIQPVAKELIKRLPRSSPLISEVEMALQNTGVVSGVFGIAEAYDSKRSEVLDWLQDPNERIRTFAAKYIADLQTMSEIERRRAEEFVALRKFEYGED
ncbi:hypothetical protein DJFAAGMI_04212 [Comamonas sp. PE63]|uniref:HEAT repeat domain-containing protein n=1 Tax=Comamonas brasiliensis TaxID=1812482 RepID=A0ABS5LY59_9BURK|nr:hypothetical protein [Comamonas sp. PE63]MBS3021439.1 hypothetical protein [Comamonas sp. PE63]